MKQVLRVIAMSVIAATISTTALQAQSDGAKIYKTNCVLCHSADGSADSPTGKALKVKDLRSQEVQKQSDSELADVITKGRNKMPAFGQKLKPEEIQALVGYIRQLAKK